MRKLGLILGCLSCLACSAEEAVAVKDPILKECIRVVQQAGVDHDYSKSVMFRSCVSHRAHFAEIEYSLQKIRSEAALEECEMQLINAQIDAEIALRQFKMISADCSKYYGDIPDVTEEF